MMYVTDEYYPKSPKKNIFEKYRDNTEAHRQRIAKLPDTSHIPIGWIATGKFRYDDEPQLTTKQKENNMFKDMAAKMMNRMFRRVDNAVWDMMTGKIGIQTDDGIATIDGVGDDAQISINIMEQFGMPLPAFAQSTPVDAIKEGDFIYNANRPLGWIVEKKEKSFRILKTDGTRTTWTPPKVTTIGFDLGAGGPLVLRSLFNTLPGGESGLAGLQGMLMPMLMLGGDVDLESMLPMILMSQTGMMGGAAGGNGNMIQMMMMMNMMKGGDNPMKNLFGGTSSGKTGNNHFGRGM
jgi:hypothetical protein